MSQLHARLFEKWLNAGGDLTFSEWLAERREYGRRMRTPGATIPVPATFFQQQMMTAMQRHQRGLPMILSQAFGGLAGGIFR